MLGKCAFVECPCEDGEDVAVAACSSCKPVHHMCSKNIHEGALNVRVCSNDCCVALGLKKPSSGPAPTSVALPVANNAKRNSTGANAKARAKAGVESARTMNVATPVRRSSPRRVSLDANTPNQDRAAQGPNPRPSPYQRRSPRLELLRETVPSHDPLIKLSVDVRLKDTVNQRLSSSGQIGTHRVQCDTWDEVKTKHPARVEAISYSDWNSTSMDS
ncbi:hypothetical protein V7S43_006498 [Phytophthora oleae]|uniref:Zinc finger PHD-type domain-containing protein n=1 Tax=Phytophthora oleae TaxID=2107226 RepID=A0ABD3FRS9_9STRA